VSYTSDSTGQLLSATATSGPPSESYSYDSNGNRETVTTTGGQVTCITGPNNELLYDGTYYYQYDADGNQVARWVDNNGVSESSPQPNDTDITIYTWDNRNRLTSVTSYANYDAYIGTGDYTSPTPEQTVTYMYDVFNRWIGETITNYASGVVTSVNKTAFVYDGNQIVLQFDNTTGAELAATDLSHRYLWGPAVDQLLADEQVTNGLSQSGTVVWTFTDNENTVRDLATYSNGTTTVVNHREFSAYGELLSQTNTSVSPATVATVDCLFAYTGRALDEATGLQNNDNRWYDATTGRWFSQDPIGFWGGTSNLYRYCGNSPTSRTDSNGESSWNPYNPEFYSSIWKPNSPPPAAPAPPPPAAPAPPPPAAPAPPPPGPSRGGSSAGEWCEHVAPVAAQGVLDAAAEAAHTTAAPFDVAFELIKATPDFANVLVSQAVKNAAADALAHPEHYNRQQLDQVYVWVHRLQDVEGRRQLQHCD
jgi:RHS repeat-associated protein